MKIQPSDLKPYKSMDTALQTLIIIVAIVAALSFEWHRCNCFLPLFVLFALAQMSSFFIHHYYFRSYRQSPARKIYKVLLIIHHVLIIPSALMMFIPLMFTATILCILYYGITVVEYVKLK